MNNKKLIKNLLATASAVAVLATGASALATEYYVDPATAAPTLSTGASIFVASTGAAAGAAIAAGNHTFDLVSANTNALVLDVASAGNTYTVNLAGRNAQVIDLGAAVTLALTNDTSIVPAIPNPSNASTANAAIHAANTNAQAVLKFTAAANSALVRGLEQVSQVDFNNNNQTLTVGDVTATAGKSAGKFTGTTFKTNTAQGGTVAFVQDAEIYNGVTVAGAANSLNEIKVADGKTLTLSGTTNLTTGAIANGITTNAGTITLKDTAASGNITVGTTGAVNVGAGTTASAITLTANGTANVNANGRVTTLTANNAGSVIKLNGGTVTTLAAAAGGDGVVTVSADSTVGFLGNGNSVASVNFASDNKLTLGNGGAHAVNGAITTATDQTGSILISGNDLTAGNVGDATHGLKQIQFASAKTLTVNGTIFNANVDSGVGAGNQGTVAFANAGAVTVTGNLGTTTSLGALTKVNITNAAGNVAFGSSLYNVATLNFGAVGAQASLTAVNGSAMAVDNVGAAGAAGKLTLTNPNLVALSSLGNANALQQVTIDGPGGLAVAANGAAKVQTLAFTANAAGAIVTVDKLDNLGNAGAVTTTTNQVGLIQFRTASALPVDYGAANHGLGGVEYIGAVAAQLDLATHDLFGANISASSANKLTIANAGANGVDNRTYGNLGDSTNYLAAVTFVSTGGAANNTTVGSVDSNLVNVNDATNVIFGGAVTGHGANAKLNLAAAGSLVTFNKDANIAIAATTNGAGKATFAGSGTVGAIGAAGNTLAQVSFTGANQNVSLTGDIYSLTATAGSVSFIGTGTYTLNKDVNIASGQANFATGATLNLGKNKLTLTEAAVSGGVLNLNLTADNQVNGSLSSTNALTGATALKVLVTAPLSATVLKDVITYTNAGTAANLALLKLNSNAVQSWSATQGSSFNAATLTQNVNVNGFKDSVKGLSDDAKGLSVALLTAQQAGTAAAGSETYNLVNIALDALNAGAPQVASDALNRVAGETGTTAHTATLASDLSQQATDRLAVTGVGVASGDEATGMNFGVWGHGFGAKATAKARKGDSGYTANTGGGTVGVDTAINDNLSLGLAATFASSNVKFKDTRSGDKAKLTNTFFSLYGRYDLGNNWFVQGSAGFGSGTAKVTTNRVVDSTGKYASLTGSYDTMAFNLEALAGYNYNLGSATVTPVVGVRYLNVNEGGYTEKGADSVVGKRTITKKAASKFTGILGGSVSGAFDTAGTTVTPEVHAYLNYDLAAKNPKVEAKLDGLTGAFDVSAAKPARFSTVVGAGVSARTNNLEYGVTYNARLSDKFVSHQGTLRLKVDL